MKLWNISADKRNNLIADCNMNTVLYFAVFPLINTLLGYIFAHDPKYWIAHA